MPRSSLPSINITCAYGNALIRLNRISLNLISAGRLSASTTAKTSAPTSCITCAVFWVATWLTGAIFSSTQPIHDARPSATISILPFVRFSSRPRFWRSCA